MKRRWLMRLTLGVIVLAIAAPAFVSQTRRGIQEKLEETRRELREQGFKTELSDFDLSVPPDVERRASAVVNIGILGDSATSMRMPLRELMVPVDTNVARIAWQESRLQTEETKDLWPQLSLALVLKQSALEEAGQELLSGPISFPPTTLSSDGDYHLPTLTPVRGAGIALASSVIVELHNGNPDHAWTNLLTLTRLATSWKPGPIAVSHLIRFSTVDYAQAAAWEALQYDGWNDDQLSALQHEWESADFFSELPQTVAFSRVCKAARFEAERMEPLYEPGVLNSLIEEFMESPANACREVSGLVRAWRHRSFGSYADEISILLYYRNCEIELTKAVKLSTWTEMLAIFTNTAPLPGTEFPEFAGPGGSGFAPASPRRSPLARAAETEATRRITVVAIALERHRRLTGAYPQSLADLVPRFLKSEPFDFIDGAPLHYERVGERQFVLYSPGADCLDNGGVSKRLIRERSIRATGVDLVWPRPATAVELEHFNQALDIARRLRDGENVNIPGDFKIPLYLQRNFQQLSPGLLPEDRQVPNP